MSKGIQDSVTLNVGLGPTPAPAPQLFEGYLNYRADPSAPKQGENMALDVAFPEDQETVTGATVVPGVKMTDEPKPAAPAPTAQQATPKSGDAAVKGGDSTAQAGKPADIRWPQSAEDAQGVIDRLMKSPTFAAD
jgi:hypothetical protein